MEKNRTRVGLIQAVREITLIVISIVLALQVNIWYEKGKEKKRLNNVYSRIVLDIDNNIKEANEILEFHDGRKCLFESVMTGSVSPEHFKDRLDRLITGALIYDMDKTGVDQLKTINTQNSTAIRVIRTFDKAVSNINTIEDELVSNSMATLEDWRDNYSWFPDWLVNDLNSDAKTYFLTSPNYRNKVTYNYILVYKGQVPALNGFIEELKNIKEIMKKEMD